MSSYWLDPIGDTSEDLNKCVKAIGQTVGSKNNYKA